jgi:hypothetical protein
MKHAFLLTIEDGEGDDKREPIAGCQAIADAVLDRASAVARAHDPQRRFMVDVEIVYLGCN